MRNPPTDYDGAWKEALEVYLQPFLGLAFPAVAAAIDWAQPVKFLNTELQELVAQAELGKQRADTLVEVTLRDGQSELILIHVEVQAHRDSDLSRRMYRYHHRILKLWPGGDPEADALPGLVAEVAAARGACLSGETHPT